MYQHYKFVNIPLPYGYDGLEPYIDKKTMELHHDRHLQTYIDNLNHILKDYPALQMWSLEKLICHVESLPKEIQEPVEHNAGGVYNHEFYFRGMMPSNGSVSQPTGALFCAIDAQFGDFQTFIEEFKQQATSLFGSGYTWLVLNKNGDLEIVNTANQDTPIACHMLPILNIDVWEHAYYLKHYNERAKYVNDWLKVVNWPQAEMNYEAACKFWNEKIMRM